MYININCQLCETNPRTRANLFDGRVYLLCLSCHAAGKFATGLDLTDKYPMHAVYFCDVKDDERKLRGRNKKAFVFRSQPRENASDCDVSADAPMYLWSPSYYSDSRQTRVLSWDTMEECTVNYDTPVRVVASPRLEEMSEAEYNMVIIDILSLVDTKVTPEEVLGWTLNQKFEAEFWASRAHLYAGDNDVAVPPKPTFLIKSTELPDGDFKEFLDLLFSLHSSGWETFRSKLSTPKYMKMSDAQRKCADTFSAALREAFPKTSPEVCPRCKGTRLDPRKAQIGLKLYCRACGGSGVNFEVIDGH